MKRTDMDNCLEAIIQVCRNHGMILSHEDGHGGFLLKDRSKMEDKHINIYENWLREADESRR